MPNFLTASAFAARLGVDVGKVIAWLNDGTLRGVNVARSAKGKKARWRISEAEIERFLSTRQNPTPAQPKQKTRVPTTVGYRSYY